ncbi:hypothetical protein [Shimia biformata]|uniref:hypothetical protein n=1 Tax=Shimia biformata TaxID=1294299 RepID=UPI0019513F67|nr:hypothetical protein [Shimia biformata]
MHEFHTTVRYLQRERIQWPVMFKLCGRIQDEAITDFVKTTGTIFLMYLIATSLENDGRIELTISKYSIGVAAEFYFAFLAYVIFVGSMQFNHLSTSMSLKNSVSTRLLLNGFSATTYDVIEGGSRNALGIPHFINSYFKERLPTSTLLGVFMLLSIFSAMLPLFWPQHMYRENCSCLSRQKTATLLKPFAAALACF